MKLSNLVTFTLVTLIVCCMVSPAFALYTISNEGLWPKSWPKEMEPLRKQARSRWGPTNEMVYQIPFATREQFESAWPHILKLQSQGTSVKLLRGPHTIDGRLVNAGVRIVGHAPIIPIDPKKKVVRSASGDETALARPKTTSSVVDMTRMIVTNIELVVDEEIVDLNRIHLPSAIIDQRQLTDTDRSSTEVKSLSPANALTRLFEPLRSGTWRGKWDHKVDGKVATKASWWDLQLDFRNDSVTGHVLKISDGSSSDSILSGQVIRAISKARSNPSSARYGRFVSVLVLRQDTSDNGYFVINTAHRVSENRFLGTWVDSIGQVGDFEMTLTEEE